MPKADVCSFAGVSAANEKTTTSAIPALFNGV